MTRNQRMHRTIILSLSILLLCVACSRSENTSTETSIDLESQETIASPVQNQASNSPQNYTRILDVEVSGFESGNFDLQISLDLLSSENLYLGMLTGVDGSQIFLPCSNQTDNSDDKQLHCVNNFNLAGSEFQIEVAAITPEFANYVSNRLSLVESELITEIVAYWDSWSACKNWATNDRKPDWMDDYCAETYPETGWAFTDPDDIWLDLQNQDEPFNCLCFDWWNVEDIVENEIPVEGQDGLCNFTLPHALSGYNSDYSESDIFTNYCPSIWNLYGGTLLEERYTTFYVGNQAIYLLSCFACESSPCCTDENMTMMKYLYCSAANWYENNAQFGDEEFYLEDTCISQEHFELANQCIQSNGWQYAVQINTENDLVNFYRYMLENHSQGQWRTPCKEFVQDLWDCTYEFEYIVPEGWEDYSSMVAPDCDKADSENSLLCQSLAEDDPINGLAANCANELNISEYSWPYTQYQALSILEGYFFAKPMLEPGQAPMCKIYSQLANFLLDKSTGQTTFDLFFGDVPHTETISNQVTINFPGSTISSQQDDETSQSELDEISCAEIGSANPALVVVGFLDPSDTFSTYLKFPDRVRGTSDEERDLNYSATLGDLPEAQCFIDGGYPDRLYCNFKNASSIAGTAKPFEVRLEGCDSPIFRHERVSLVRNSQEEPTDQDTCTKPDPPSSDPCYIWDADTCEWECRN